MTQLSVLIPTARPIAVSGVKDGKPWSFVKQACLVTLPNGNVEACTLIAPKKDGQSSPYAPGNYELDPASFYVRNGELAFAPRLRPVAGGTK